LTDHLNRTRTDSDFGLIALAMLMNFRCAGRVRQQQRVQRRAAGLCGAHFAPPYADGDRGQAGQSVPRHGRQRQTGSRRIISYLLPPLSRYRHDSLRERWAMASRRRYPVTRGRPMRRAILAPFAPHRSLRRGDDAGAKPDDNLTLSLCRTSSRSQANNVIVAGTNVASLEW